MIELYIKDNCLECDRSRVFLSKKKVNYKVIVTDYDHHTLRVKNHVIQGLKNIIDFMKDKDVRVEHCDF